MNKVNLREKFEQIHDYWTPRIAAELHGLAVKLVKVQGEFEWHHHDSEDELFLVVRGRFQMQFRDRGVRVEEGEFPSSRMVSSIDRWPWRRLICWSSSLRAH